MSPVLLFLLVASAWAQLENVQRSARRVPQGYIQYTDPTGLKVNWKLYAPYNQWRAQLEESTGRTQRAEMDTAQPQSPIIRSPDRILTREPEEPPYKPYTALPDHLKHLILRIYEPQRPYVNPTAFIYGSNTLQEPQQQQPQQQQQQQSDPRFLITVPEQQDVKYERPSARYQSIDEKTAYESRVQKQPPSLGFRQDYEEQQTQIVHRRGFDQQQQQQASQLDFGQRYEQQKVAHQHAGIEYKPSYQQHPEQQRSQLIYEHHYQPRQPPQPAQSQLEYRQIHAQQSAQPQGHIEYRQSPPPPPPQQQQQQHSRIEAPRAPQSPLQNLARPVQQSEQTQSTIQRIAVPLQQPPVPQQTQPYELSYYKNTPAEIQQLLQYQAQIPYDVIANGIIYRPKTIFMPKPLPEEVKDPYYYRSKVYYLKDGEVEDEHSPP